MALSATNRRTLNYFGITITLAANTTTNLLNALRAIEPDCPATAREVTLQNDVTSPQALFIGDAKVASSPQRCGYELGLGDTKTYRSSSVQDVPLGAIFLRSTGIDVVNVEGWC
jgi:hypothetical protein